LTADGTKHAVEGCVDIPNLLNGKLKIIPTLVLPSMSQRLILGIDFWNTFGIVPQRALKTFVVLMGQIKCPKNIQIVPQIGSTVLKEYLSVFDLEELPVDHSSQCQRWTGIKRPLRPSIQKKIRRPLKFV
jgi:hypothetical protein